MNKFGNIVTAARRQLDMNSFMYVSDVVALNDSASPISSYCYLDRMFDKKTIHFMYGQDDMDLFIEDGAGSYVLPEEFVMVSRNNTAFPQVMHAFGVPNPLTISKENHRMLSWQHTIAGGDFWSRIDELKSYKIYGMEDGEILRLSAMMGDAPRRREAVVYIFNKKHLSDEQRGYLDQTSKETFMNSIGPSSSFSR